MFDPEQVESDIANMALGIDSCFDEIAMYNKFVAIEYLDLIIYLLKEKQISISKKSDYEIMLNRGLISPEEYHKLISEL